MNEVGHETNSCPSHYHGDEALDLALLSFLLLALDLDNIIVLCLVVGCYPWCGGTCIRARLKEGICQRNCYYGGEGEDEEWEELSLVSISIELCRGRYGGLT